MRTLSRSLLLIGLAAACAAASDYPQAQIANGEITAVVLLPDAKAGYYRGTRFDWSGAIMSLKYKGHEYYGPWREHDPLANDAVPGPVEDYRDATGNGSIGYSDAKPGEKALRIGVGMIRKPDEKPYNFGRTYEIVNPGAWSVKAGKDKVEFRHRLQDDSGYGYDYRKTVRLAKGKPQLVIEHRLKNTGKKPLDGMQYNHNFFVIDGQPSGPEMSVEFPFELKPVRRLMGPARVEGGRIVFERELASRQSVFGEFTGFGDSAKDYDIRVENRKSGAGVRITGDVPLTKVVFWSVRSTVCPEPYIAVKAEPGKEARWTYTYDFYTR